MTTTPTYRRYLYILTLVVPFVLFAGLLTAHAAGPTEVSGTISSNTTWDASNSPYVVTGNITVSNGVTLTVDPGVTVKFEENRYMQIYGTLDAQGTATSTIYFTSIHDDDADGHDTNEATTTPSKGDWYYIRMYTAGDSAVFKNAVIRYGGGNFSFPTNIYNSGGDLTVTDSEIASSSNRGVYMTSGTSTIDATDIKNNTNYGLYITGGNSLAVTGSTFSDNDTAAYVSNNVWFTHSNNAASGGSINGFEMYGTINSDRTWTGDDMPYVLDSSLSVGNGSTLTVKPNAVIKLAANRYLQTLGTLDVQGSATGTVYITSIKDDSVGGDTNGDGSSSGSPGDWNYIRIYGAGDSATFDHTVIRYGGGYVSWPANIYNSGGELTLTDSEVSSSSDRGVYMTSGTSTIDATAIKNNAQEGLNITGGNKLTVTDSTFSDNGTAAYISNNISFTHSGNTASGTGIGGFELYGSISSDTTWTSDGMPYVIGADITMGANYDWTFEPGVVVKFDGNRNIYTNGTFTASGTKANPIYFTSIKDDTIGGDTNGDGTSTTPAAGDWNRMEINPGYSAIFRQAVVRYGGSNNSYGMIRNEGETRVENSEMGYAQYKGFRNESSGSSTVTYSDIHDNDYGFYVIGDDMVVSSSTIRDNASYGAYKTGSPSADMENNYWGASDGPSGSGPGSGDKVNTNIDYDPYLTEDPLAEEGDPTSFYAEIKNTGNGRTVLRSTPDATVTSNYLMRLPEDWIVYVSSTDEATTTGDGYTWCPVVYKTEHSDGEVSGWMIADASSSEPWLEYVSSTQDALEASSTDYVATSTRRASKDNGGVIQQAFAHYYHAASGTGSLSLYDNDNGNSDIWILKHRGFPEAVLWGMAARESGGGIYQLSNDIVSKDYGHGVMQLTFDAYDSSTPNQTANFDNRGIASYVNTGYELGDEFPCSAVDSLKYTKCYDGGGSTSTADKPYQHYEGSSSQPIYRQYSNSRQSIYANIKDAMRKLESEYEENSALASQITTSTTKGSPPLEYLGWERELIIALAGYNGICAYNDLVADRLDVIDTFFTDTTSSTVSSTLPKMHAAGEQTLCAQLHSPGELRIEDSQGQVVGIVNGKGRSDFDWGVYDKEEEWVKLFFPEEGETYTYKVVGTGDGVFGLDITEKRGDERITYSVTRVPVKSGTIVTYELDRDAILNGEKGVTIRIDDDGDGLVDTVTSNSALVSYDLPFVPPMLEVSDPPEPLPPPPPPPAASPTSTTATSSDSDFEGSWLEQEVSSTEATATTSQAAGESSALPWWRTAALAVLIPDRVLSLLHL